MKTLKLKEDKKKMNKDVKPKQWYQLSNGAEYSKDFKFFVENQIFVSRSGKQHSFCSRLEKKIFKIVTAGNKSGIMTDSDIELTCKVIHQQILQGKYGKGVLQTTNRNGSENYSGMLSSRSKVQILSGSQI